MSNSIRRSARRELAADKEPTAGMASSSKRKQRTVPSQAARNTSAKRKSARSTSASQPPSEVKRARTEEDRAATLPATASDNDSDYPDSTEWENRKKFVRYKTCQLGGRSWAVGDFVKIWGADASRGVEGEEWIGKILHIRANGTERVFCQVEWVYRSMKDLQNANCRNVPSSRTISFPQEVVLGQGDSLLGMITVQCINAPAQIEYYDEADPLARALPYGTTFYRSVLREPTQKEVQAEEAAAQRYTGSKQKIRMWNAKLPFHSFDAAPTCYCHKPYMPLPADAAPMVLCPRKGCMKWYHQSCLDRAERFHTSGLGAIDALSMSGLDLLERNQAVRGHHLIGNTANGDALEDNESRAGISDINTTAAVMQTLNGGSIRRDGRGVPLALVTAAKSSIIRGTSSTGIVGDARCVLEARLLLKQILAELEVVPGTATPKPKRGRPSTSSARQSLGASAIKATARAALDLIRGENIETEMEQRLQEGTKQRLSAWLSRYGSRSDYPGESADAAEATATRETCWLCPACDGPI